MQNSHCDHSNFDSTKVRLASSRRFDQYSNREYTEISYPRALATVLLFDWSLYIHY